MSGKAARNEARKLTATYLNNIAVALFIAGVGVPFVTALSKTREEVAQWFAGLFTWHGLVEPNAFAAAFFAFVLSFVVHALARRSVADVED
jgi:F0F1-type ATP synthase membrane subunit c/vacuolar-type H+-ATPase subunit K